MNGIKAQQVEPSEKCRHTGAFTLKVTKTSDFMSRKYFNINI